MAPTSELLLLATLARNGNVSMVAVDHNACVTHIAGDIKLGVHFDEKSAIGQTIEVLFPDNPEHAKLYRDALDNRPSKIQIPDNRGGISEVQILPLHDENGTTIGAFGFEYDVTARVKLEKTTETYESLVSDIFSSIQDGMFIITPDYTVLKSNPAFEAMYSELLPLLGNKCYITAGLDHACEECPATTMFKTGKAAASVHYKPPTATCPGMWLDHCAHPIFDSSGNISAAICIVRDITRRKEEEDALKQQRNGLERLISEQTRDLELSESTMRAILSGGSVPILFINPERNITFANAAAQALTGYAEEELLGQPVWSLVQNELIPSNSPFLQRLQDFREGKTDRLRHDVLFQRKDGEKRWVDFTASKVNDPEGGTYHTVLILLDITERYQMDQAVADASEQTQIMLDATPLGCSLMEEDGTVIDCNLAVLNLLDVPSKQEFCKRFYELSPEIQPDGINSRQKAQECIAWALNKGSCRVPWMHQKPDGTQIPCEVTLVRIKRRDRYIFAGYARDLREENRMRAKLRESDERIQLMFDANPLCCVLWDEQLNTLACNMQAVEMFELKDKQEFCDRFYDLSPKYQPNGRLSRELALEYSMKTLQGPLCRFEWMHQKLDGTPIPAEVTLTRVKQGDTYILAGYIRDLREEKRMRAKMREADERIKLMFEANPLSCVLIDEHFNLLDCNMQAIGLFGLEDTEDIRDKFPHLLPKYQPDGCLSLDAASEHVRKALQGTECRFEWVHQTLGGTPIPAEVTLTRVKQGNTFILASYIRDLREEKRMLAKIREADERTQIMLDATPLGCSLVRRDMTVIDCNLAVCKLYGLSNKQEYIDRFFDLMPDYQPDGQPSRKRACAEIMKAFETGYNRVEWVHQQLDGTPLPAEVTLVRVKRGEEDIVAGYTRDLREVKQHEAIRQRERQRSNVLLELAHMTQMPTIDVIDYIIKHIALLTDSTMGYVVMLEQATDTLPFRSAIFNEMYDCSLPGTTAEGTPHVLSPVLTECLETREVVIHNDMSSLPGERVFPKGHYPVHSHMNFPITDGERPIGIIGIGNKETPYTDFDARHLTLLAHGLSNVLNRKKYEENLEQAKNEAEQANKAKSEFLAHMSHEIRTPLNGVIGLSELLSGTALNSKQNEYVQLIRESGNALLFLINDILDFSKIEAGKLDIEYEPFDLASTVQTVLASLISRASAKNLALAVSICRNLPQIVQGDAGRIRQILLNLMGNAVKFTEKGGVRVDITIESMTESVLTVRFSVVDTGIGIPKHGIDRLFKAFSQVNTSSARTYGGTGLGLAISMRLVQLMNGEIGVESEEGKGSTFWFTIPFECDAQVNRCFQIKTCLDQTCPNRDGHLCTLFVHRNIDTEYSPAGRYALIVNGNEVQREALSVQLDSWDMQCVTCSTREETLRLAQTYREQGTPFDIFFVDGQSSEGDGLDLIRALFEQEEEQNDTNVCQAILLRSISEDYDVNTVDADRIEMVTKPIFASALFNAVMTRIFTAKVLRDAVPGITLPGNMMEQRESKSKAARLGTAGQSANAMDRFKSSFAGKIHVLIVEDNRVNQIVTKNLLEEAGFSSDIANNGVEACSAVRNKHYNVVLMDCQMPEMDGFEATRLIRNWELEQNKKRLPIIALTANATKEDVQRCLDAGMDAYCSKPINPQFMLRLIEEWYEKGT